MRFALNSLAVVAPEWLLAHSDAEWVERYGHRIEESRLPKSEGDRLALAELLGEDGWKVLFATFDPLAPAFLREIPAIQVLRQIWVQNDCMVDGHLRWRAADNIPPATLFISSPYDPEAHLGKKRSTLWTGYKVHLTETCEQTLPHLLTHVATTPAPKTDEAMTEQLQEELHQADLAPGEHFVDAGYVSARVLVKSQERFGIEVVGTYLGLSQDREVFRSFQTHYRHFFDEVLRASAIEGQLMLDCLLSVLFSRKYSSVKPKHSVLSILKCTMGKLLAFTNAFVSILHAGWPLSQRLPR